DPRPPFFDVARKRHHTTRVFDRDEACRATCRATSRKRVQTGAPWHHKRVIQRNLRTDLLSAPFAKKASRQALSDSISGYGSSHRGHRPHAEPGRPIALTLATQAIVTHGTVLLEL